MKCQRCKKRKAMITYSENPMMSVTHGYPSEKICKQCYVSILIEAKIDLDKRIHKIKEELG